MQLISRGAQAPTEALIRPMPAAGVPCATRCRPHKWWLWIITWTSARICRCRTAPPLSSVCLISHQSLVMCERWPWRVTGNQGSIPERQPEKRLPRLRTAAGTQITQSQNSGEVVTKNNDAGAPFGAPQSEWVCLK